MQPSSEHRKIEPGSLTLEEIVARTSDLPSMPAAVLAVMKETEASNGSAHSVARHLAQDQALTARVLRLANSAFYGLPRKIMDVQEAVVVLGMRSVRSLAIVASTYPWLTKPLPGYSMGPNEMWTHSLGVGVAAQVIAKRTNHEIEQHAFTAGILHDLGKVVLSVWLESRIAEMVAMAQEQHLTLDEMERQVLGFDHAEAGAMIGQTWNLPTPLIQAMQFHHRPAAVTEDSELIDCVHLADFLVAEAGISHVKDGLKPRLDESSIERLHIPVEDIESLTEECVEVFHDQEKLLEGDQAA